MQPGQMAYDREADIDLIVETLSNHISGSNSVGIDRVLAERFWSRHSHNWAAGWLMISDAQHIIDAYEKEVSFNPVVRWEVARSNHSDQTTW